MNQLRGTNPYIMDRWDLTMECIRRFYLGQDSPLFDVLNRDREFYEMFVDFKGYVDFFFLHDCVTPDYSKVVFWMDDSSLSHTFPLPRTAGEHIVWMEKCRQFIQDRAERMKNALQDNPDYKYACECLTKADYEFHNTESLDNYYEVIDEVADMLRRDASLEVSTKGLRATPYAGGYVRYMKINGYSCGVLFDKDNWKNTDSVMTPFWLSVSDQDWKMSEEIRSWLDTIDKKLISKQWQKKPCLALIPLANAPFHQVCANLEQQIVNSISELEDQKHFNEGLSPNTLRLKASAKRAFFRTTK